MATKRVIDIAIEGKADGAKKAMKETGDEAEGLGSKLGSLGKSFGSMATIAGGVFAGGILAKAPGIVGGLSSSFKDLELQAKKTSTVFGADLTGDLNDWANEVAASMGLTTMQAKNAATGLADLLIPMGMTRDQAFDMSTKTIGLAGALAEWSGGAKNATEVSEILQSAYLGETDGLKALGISISAADVQQRLMEKGQDKLTGSALQQAQALAIQELVFEKSTDAQKAFAEGAGSVARKQAEMTAKMGEAKEKLAMALGPAITQVTSALASGLLPALDYVGRAIDFGSQKAKDFEPTLRDMAARFGELRTEVADRLAGPLKQLWDMMGGVKPTMIGLGIAVGAVVVPAFIAWAAATIVAIAPILAVVAAVAALTAGIAILVNNDDFQRYYRDEIKPAMDNILEAVDQVIGFFREHWPEIQKIVQPVIDQVRNMIETQVKVIVGIFKILIDLIQGDFSGAWKNLKQLVKDVWDGIKDTISNSIDLIKGLAPLLLAAGKALGGALMDGIKAALGAGAGFAGDVAEAVLDAVKNIVNSQVIDRINRVLEFDFDTHIPGVGKLNINPADIPHLAKGGIVDEPTIALIGEKGPEAVVPLDGDYIQKEIPNKIIVGGITTGGTANGGGLTSSVGPPANWNNNNNNNKLPVGDFSPVININVHAVDLADPDLLARKLAPHMVHYLEKYGRKIWAIVQKYELQAAKTKTT